MRMIMDDYLRFPSAMASLYLGMGADAPDWLWDAQRERARWATAINSAKQFYVDGPSADYFASYEATGEVVRLPFLKASITISGPCSILRGRATQAAIMFDTRRSAEDGETGLALLVLETADRMENLDMRITGSLPGIFSTGRMVSASFDVDPSDNEMIGETLDLEAMGAFLAGFMGLLSEPRPAAGGPSLPFVEIERQDPQVSSLRYTEIAITKHALSEAGEGGTARTPRGLYWRRGHVRTYSRTGKQTWVNAHPCGDERFGIIKSRYVAGDTPGDEWKGGPLPAPKMLKKERDNG